MRRLLLQLLLFLPIACGESTPEPDLVLTTATNYDLVGVARVMPDGIAVTSQHVVYLTVSNVSLQGARVNATVAQKGGPEYPVRGSFNPEDGVLLFEPFTGALSGNATEDVAAFGGRLYDSSPVDGIADEWVGFVNTSSGTPTVELKTYGVARRDGRPNAPDATKLTRVQDGPAVTLSGSAGAIGGRYGVEVLRFPQSRTNPEGFSTQARADGSFSISLDGLANDIFLLRVRQGERLSEATPLLP